MSIPMSERIIFIEKGFENEEFSYDFAPLAQEVRELREKVKQAASVSLDYTGAFFSTLNDTAYQVLRKIPSSFAYSVLGIGVGIPATIEVLFFKTICWAGALALSSAISFYTRFAEKLGWILQENQAILTSIAKTLDARHFRSQELKLDASGVPADVAIDSLLDMFDQINFSNETDPGYMAVSSRQEDDITYTTEELRGHLTTFASHVKNKTPFIGTPPSYDVLALLKFYEQIEDAVRLSIHKSNKDLKAFQKIYGSDITTYDPKALNQYKNILEDRSRLVIDLAIAGAHCGARYMGDSMNVYSNFYGSSSQNGKTLEDSLIGILAGKRKQIVERMIQEKSNGSHNYAEHMSLLGEILGLPGTAGVVEHLSHKLNRDERLKTFFESYKENAIIDSLNEKWQDVKNGASFRVQIYDWITTLMGDWNQGKYAEMLASDEIQSFKAELDSLKTAEFDVLKEMAQLHLLTSLIRDLADLQDLTSDKWNAFLESILAAEQNESAPAFQAKARFRARINTLASRKVPSNTLPGQIKTATTLEARKIIESIKTNFSAETLGKEALSSLVYFPSGKTSKVDVNPFIEAFSKQKKHTAVLNLFRSLEGSKAKEILATAHIEKDSALRFLNGTLPAEELLENTYDKVRRNEFIEKFQVYGDAFGHTNNRYQDLERREQIQKTTNNEPVVDAEGQPVYEEKITYKPLPAALLEVLLVSHQIFLPQSITDGGN